MDTLTLAQISAGVDAAFTTAAAQKPAQQVKPQSIGANAILRTDVYTGPKGSGFVVAAVVNLGWNNLVIAKQSGPETSRNQPLDRKAILAALNISYAATCAAGVTINGVKWKATQEALNSFTALSAHFREKEAALTTDEERAALHASLLTITDFNDAPHSVSVLDFRAFLSLYGDALLSLWNTFAAQRAFLAS